MSFKGIMKRMIRKRVSPAETPWQRASAEVKKNKEQKLKPESVARKVTDQENKFPKKRLNYLKRKRVSQKQKKSEQFKGRHSYRKWYLLFLTGVFGMGYFISPFGKVQDIFVEGTAFVPEQNVIDASRISGKVTALGVIASTKKINAHILTSLPQIKAVHLTLKDFNDIIIVVEEYDTSAYVYSNKVYYNVLETGEIVKTGLKVPIGNAPIITSFEMNQNLDDLLEQYMQLTDAVQNSISEIKYTGTQENPYGITVYMNDGNEIKAVLPTFAEKILYYPDIASQLGEAKGIIDLEVGVFFTPFSESSGETTDLSTEAEISQSEDEAITDDQLITQE